MPDRSPLLLLANHATSSLPAIEPALQERGYQLRRTSHLLETLHEIDAAEPALVVYQPLTGALDGFEVEQVLAHGGEERSFALVLLLPHAPAPELVARAAHGLDDLVIGEIGAEELLLRVELALARRARLDQLVRTRRALEQQSITDFKTGLLNDRYFFQRLREEVARSRRHKLALSLVLIDLDDFKSINDSLDHVFGDFVLLAFGRKLRAVVRQIDIPARLGGDEFALLLPNTDLEEAALLASRLREAILQHAFEKDGRSTRVRVSMGIDSMQGDELIEPEDFLRRADAALLEAKRRGKDRICLFPEIAPALKSATAQRGA